MEDGYTAITASGTTLKELRSLGSSAFTLALGESMLGSGENSRGTLWHTLSGVWRTNRLGTSGSISASSRQLLSGNPVYQKNIAANVANCKMPMLDTHFYFGAKRVSLALEPDLLVVNGAFPAVRWEPSIHAAVTTTRIATRWKHLPSQKRNHRRLTKTWKRLAGGI